MQVRFALGLEDTDYLYRYKALPVLYVISTCSTLRSSLVLLFQIAFSKRSVFKLSIEAADFGFGKALSNSS